MDAKFVVGQVVKAGGTIQLTRDKILVSPTECITDGLRFLIRQNRDAVFNYLQTALGEQEASALPLLSETTIILKMQHLIELIIKKGWDDYGYRFAPTEAARQITTIDGLPGWTDTYLDARAESIVIRMIQARGQAPNDWTKVSRCSRCGDVWSDHGFDTISCGWCWMRDAGKPFPRPKDTES